MRKNALLALLVPLALLAAACGDDDDGDGGGDATAELSSEEQEYADAISIGLRSEDENFGVTEAEADCMAASMVRGLGVELFEENDVEPADFESADSPAEVIGDGKIPVEDAEAVVDDWLECADIAAGFAEASQDEFGLDDAGVACLSSGLSEGNLIGNILVQAFVSTGDDAPDSEAVSRLLGLLQECSGGDGSPDALVSNLADSLLEDGTYTEEQANCMAQAILDGVGADRLAELSVGGSFDDASAEAQSEIAQAVLAAAQSCGVSITDLSG